MSDNLGLKQKWENLKTAQPGVRIRNAATALGVSEAELLATQAGEILPDGNVAVTRLNPEFREILGEIGSLGHVMALTRNDDVVHERKGTYLNPSLENPHVGLFVGEDIDLRIFFMGWAHAFSVTEMSKDAPRYSFQFFAKDGEAIHKIYMTSKSDIDGFKAITEKYKSEDQSANVNITAFAPEKPEIPDNEIDVDAFRNEWINLKDTHDFFPLLQKYKLKRTQALRLAPGGDYSVRVENSAFRRIFARVAELELPIMVFVGNRGMIQIHTGPVKKLVDFDGWFNVLDPEFNLHVKESGIHDSWIVRKPTADGVVTALECYDSEGRQIVQVFGKRKPGIPEIESWREVVAQVESESVMV